jgi:uncharacterized protein (TIGR01319 family)
MSSEKLNKSYLIVDIDNHQTKAVLIERANGSYRLMGASEAPTTADPPDLDATIGVESAARDLGRKLGRQLWAEGGPSGAHRFLCSSSSGGLYMAVAGVIRTMSAESAERAALGAGALLMDVFSKDDPRPDYKVVDRMRSLRPDMLLLAGGTDGGAVEQVLEMAGLIDAADVRPRFGAGYKLPVVYAGNVEIRDDISKTLGEDRYATREVENVRPVLEVENLGPTREGIYDSYMEHVIIHSPGYDRLAKWVDGRIIPTQAAIGKLIYAYAMERGLNLLAVDVGGATTDVYSVYNGVFNRSLNADIGMTYGISNVMREAGVQNIMRWIPGGMGEREARNIIGNIMALQPAELTSEETVVQRAAAREAMRLGLEQHRNIATRLKGIQIKRTIADIFQQLVEASIIDLMKTQSIIGRGRIFADDQDHSATTLMMIDAIQTEGVTEILVDRSSVMPHLGMLLDVDKEAALSILSEECLHRLGTCVAPKGMARKGETVMTLRMNVAGGATSEETLTFGELKALPLGPGEHAKIEVTPARRFDVGAGRGKRLEAEVQGGEFGIILDARGRPLVIPEVKGTLEEWTASLTPLAAPAPAA